MPMCQWRWGVTNVVTVASDEMLLDAAGFDVHVEELKCC